MKKEKILMEVEDFKEVRIEDFYYVDKTELIKELLDN